MTQSKYKDIFTWTPNGRIWIQSFLQILRQCLQICIAELHCSEFKSKRQSLNKWSPEEKVNNINESFCYCFLILCFRESSFTASWPIQNSLDRVALNLCHNPALSSVKFQITSAHPTMNTFVLQPFFLKLCSWSSFFFWGGGGSIFLRQEFIYSV